MEYALHQRELEDVTNALDEIEAERRQDIHDSNEKRKEFNDREDEIQVCFFSLIAMIRSSDYS